MREIPQSRDFPSSGFATTNEDGLHSDLIGGVPVWAVLVPEGLGLRHDRRRLPVVCQYAAPGALILYAAFGSSRHFPTVRAAIDALEKG
jgi:hypothetical protein